MPFDLLKQLLPDRPLLLPVLWGPFRGARIRMNPRQSLRKVFGVYEHELNTWISAVIPHVSKVLDVGANDGYFTFGCAAAFHRRRQAATIIAFEPLPQHIEKLTNTRREQPCQSISVTLKQCLVGKSPEPGIMALNRIEQGPGAALVKIDVEGAEIDVVDGATSWLKPANYFLIEVHRQEYLGQLKDKFAAAGITLLQVNQRRLPFLGNESRDKANWWLVSDLNGPRLSTVLTS